MTRAGGQWEKSHLTWASRSEFEEGNMSGDSFPFLPNFPGCRFTMVFRDLRMCVGVGEGWITHMRLSMPLSGPLLSPPALLDCEVLQDKTGLFLCVPPVSALLPVAAT